MLSKIFICSWDINRLDELPEYMKLCFLTLFNEINAMGCDVLKCKNIDVIPYFKKSVSSNLYLHIIVCF